MEARGDREHPQKVGAQAEGHARSTRSRGRRRPGRPRGPAGSPPPQEGWMRRGTGDRGEALGLLLDGFEVDRHVHVVAQHEAAGVQGLVPVDAVVLAVELDGRLEAARWLPPGSLAKPRNVTGSVTSLETPCMVRVPVTLYCVLAGRRDLRALEGDLRILLGVEEVGRAQVLVAIRVVGVDRGGLDREDDRGHLGLGRVGLDGPLEVGEAAARPSRRSGGSGSSTSEWALSTV